MITPRRSGDRGHFDHGWLDTRHTFSFAGYHDPAHMGFRTLRVINEDRVAPGGGFPTHPHRDMEIVSYVLEGAIEHEDSMGHGSVIRPGDVQRMTAGTGVTHSEYNPSDTDPLHFLQIWIIPAERGLAPEYEQKTFPTDVDGELRLVASGDGRDGSVRIHQDVDLYRARLPEGGEARHELRPGRHAWLQVVAGDLTTGEVRLEAGDGAAISDERALDLRAGSAAHFLLFDLP